ncbi:hypothetical protein LCGC14_2264260, partial [marine sediment metagenome]
IKVYFSGETSPEWEIRHARSVTISGGSVVLVFDSWLFIDPDLWEAYPTSDGVGAIDVSTVTNFVTTVDVYREYTDTTATSAVFYWERGIPAAVESGLFCTSCGGTGCTVCSYITQDGCLNARDPKRGILVPMPGAYDEDDEVWDRNNWVECREPDIVKFWYRCGEIDQRFIKGQSCDPLSNFWAQLITWLSAARLDRNLCGCTNVMNLVEDLRTDLTLHTRDVSYFAPQDVLESPFGTRKGEVMAWRRIKRLVRSRRFGVAVI